jgi:3',5'-cyclic-AMP phosphodiesterase
MTLVTGGLGFIGSPEFRQLRQDRGVYVIAHLSDPHLDGGPEAAGRLRRVTDYLGTLTRPVDVVLVTGDLADHGLPEEYAELDRALTLDLPVLVLPGNHDVSAPLRTGLGRLIGEPPGEEHPVHQVRDVGAARFVLVDSSVPGEDHGVLERPTLDWLRTTLTEPWDGPVFVCMHHPAIEVAHPVLDGWRMFSADGLAAALDGTRVTAILTGHVHAAIASTFAGVPLLVAPGIRSTVPLPFEPIGGGGDLVDTAAPPGLAFHVYDDHGALRTHYRYLP